MGKGNKNKKNKVPKINEAEYAAYIAHLKEETSVALESVEKSEAQTLANAKIPTE